MILAAFASEFARSVAGSYRFPASSRIGADFWLGYFVHSFGRVQPLALVTLATIRAFAGLSSALSLSSLPLSPASPNV